MANHLRFTSLMLFFGCGLGCSSAANGGSDGASAGSSPVAQAGTGSTAQAGTSGAPAAGAGVPGAAGSDSSPAGSANGGGEADGGGGASNSAAGTAGATHAGGSNSGGGSSASAGASGTAGAAGAGSRWIPAAGTTFYWDLQNAPPDNTRNVGAYDIDGWGNDAKETVALHARGIKVVCYMDAGTYEPERPDSSMFPASLRGAEVAGWPGELWLDVRPSGPNYTTLQSLMSARFKACKDKGFDAVEPDNLDSYQNKPGFTTSAADQLAYNEWIANTVHGLGMAVFQKNDLDQVAALEPFFDGILDEECSKYDECSSLAPYTKAKKPAWDAEYQDEGESTSSFCAADVKAGIAGALFELALDGKLFEPCTNDVGIVN
ncbi:MAG: endo alpha-1,4 polygalactosaminidase [Polyangiaceae bacterium]